MNKTRTGSQVMHVGIKTIQREREHHMCVSLICIMIISADILRYVSSSSENSAEV